MISKAALDKALKKIISSYEVAIEKALKTNKEIGNDEQIKLCSDEVHVFRDKAKPLKIEAEEYLKISVAGSGTLDYRFDGPAIQAFLPTLAQKPLINDYPE